MGLSVSGATMIDVGGATTLTVKGNDGDVTWTPHGSTAEVASLDLSNGGTTAGIKGLSGGRAHWVIADKQGSHDVIVHVGVVLIYGEDGHLYSLSPKAWQSSKVEKIPDSIPTFEEMTKAGTIGVYVPGGAGQPIGEQWTTCYVLDLASIAVSPDEE
jgi:hypothetical protein